MVRLENDPFLNELMNLYENNKTKGSVFLTYKRYVDIDLRQKKRKAETETDMENCCLIRATNGKKKISTVLHAANIIRFQMALANIQKAQLDGLKKREKKKVSKAHKD